MYQELANFLSNSYNINIDAFEIELEDLNPIKEDVDLKYFESNPIQNTSITSYSYKEPISKEWKSIVLDLNPKRVVQIAERLNEFLDEHKLDLIDLDELKNCVENLADYNYQIVADGIVFLIFRFAFINSIIDIAIPA